MKLPKLFLCALALSLALSSCKNKTKDDEIVTPIQELYGNGLAYLDKGKHKKAAEEFGKVFFEHPGNEYTPQAELMQAYSLYLAGEYEEAVDVLEIFVKLHPMNVDIAYAYYLKALSHYMQISSVQLDQSITATAKESLEDVIKRFPNTKYAVDAGLKIDLVNDHLAGKEMTVGRYYLAQKNPLAAAKRFQNVVDNYQTTSHIQEALYRLVESYMLMGLRDEAMKYAAVLGNNYPESNWYKYSFDLLRHSAPKLEEAKIEEVPATNSVAKD